MENSGQTSARRWQLVLMISWTALNRSCWLTPQPAGSHTPVVGRWKALCAGCCGVCKDTRCTDTGTHQLWDDEKRSVLAAVECVKTLVAQIQVHYTAVLVIQTVEFCCVCVCEITSSLSCKSFTRRELTTLSDVQICIHGLLMSTCCKSSRTGLLDVSRSSGR